MMLRKGSPEEAGMLPSKVMYFEDLVSTWVENDMSQAYVFLVARNNIIVSNKALGVKTPEKNSQPVEVDTIFPLASLSKPITATAAMILVEYGLLSLTFPVSYYIPEFVGENKS